MAFATARTLALRAPTATSSTSRSTSRPGVVSTTLVGRVDKSLSEARDRVRMAINNDSGRWPATKRVTILLAPADLPKAGTHYDLAIAVAVIAADKAPRGAHTRPPRGLGLHRRAVRLRRPAPGAGRAADGDRRCRARHHVACSCRSRRRPRRRLVPGMTVFGVRSLAQVSAGPARGGGARRRRPWSARRPARWRPGAARTGSTELDLGDLDGLEDVRYAVEVAAAGGHPLMLVGPRGTGKTSIAERIPTILPDLTIEQSLEVTRAPLASPGRCPTGSGLLRRPPWFAPHHSASAASVLGGGTGRVRPGEVSLAHHGVLFLDEFPHFRADVIEAMRQPLESGEVTIARGEESATYPARSLVVLAANPCPCGNFYGRGGRRRLRLHRGPARSTTSASSAARSSTGSTSGWRCDPRATPGTTAAAAAGVLRRRPGPGRGGPRSARPAATATAPWQLNAAVPGPGPRRGLAAGPAGAAPGRRPSSPTAG